MTTRLRNPVLAGLVAVASAAAFAACGEFGDEADGGGTCTDPDMDTGGGDAGPDAGAFCDRGELPEFPDGGCLATCEEACARLDACGGASAPVCPMTADECAAKCTLAYEGGHSWGNVSGNFLCCASQEACADVAGCGGWLNHPDAAGPCQLMCECWESFYGMGSLGSAQLPPPGYAWAPSAVAIVPSGETADYGAKYGVTELARGGVVFVSVPSGAIRELIAHRLRRDEVTLPTFVDGDGRISAATGRIVIEAKGPSALGAARALVAARGVASVRGLGWSKGRLSLAEGGDPWASIDTLWALNEIPGVRAELDMVRVYERRYTPDDPMFPDQWHLLNDGQDDPEITGGAQLAIEGVDGRVSEAWDVTPGVPATVIAVLDDGVNMNHPDIEPNLAPAPYNFPENWQDYMGEPYGSDVIASHGTCCAGVAAARGDNGIGVSGVCPGCTLLPALIWDQSIYPESPEDSLPLGSSLLMTDAALAGWVTDLSGTYGAAIISNSWGLGGEDPQFEGSVGAFPALPTVVGEAFDYAETDGRGGLGTLIVFAAGNSNMDVTTDPYLSHATVVGVAAADDQGLKAYYSSYGATVEVAAPSNGGLLGITTIAQSPDAGTDPQYDYAFGGTSSATPFVSGVLGLILSANPALTAAEARQVLTDSATEVDPVWGEWEDGFSPFYGHGLVNAWRAVQMANGACTDAATCTAPSDVCASGCDGTACDPCRTDGDCADGWRCQALPALGEAVCVEAVSAATCGADYVYANGYCLPTRAACGLCGASELCNGRDDDCDGYVDEDLTACNEAGPDHSYRCLQDGAGCPDGQACAATICTEGLCADSSGCATGEDCIHVKTRYGDIDADVGVCQSQQVSSGCIDRCLVRDSSGVDAEMQAFADCIDAMTECTEEAVDACRSMLPTGE